MEGKGIHTALAAIMADVDPIAKGRENKGQGFKFRGVDDVYNALHPILTKHGVVCVPEVIDRTHTTRKSSNGGDLMCVTLRVKFTLIAPDGSCVAGVMDGEAMDSGDKATSKAASIALKYFLFQTFLIPTEGDNDPDANSHELKGNSNGKPPAAPNAPQPPQQNGAPSMLSTAVPVACETCGAPLNDLREFAEKKRASGGKCPDFCCSKKTYDKATKTAGGCQFVIWSLDDWRKKHAAQPAQSAQTNGDDIPF